MKELRAVLQKVLFISNSLQQTSNTESTHGILVTHKIITDWIKIKMLRTLEVHGGTSVQKSTETNNIGPTHETIESQNFI